MNKTIVLLIALFQVSIQGMETLLQFEVKEAYTSVAPHTSLYPAGKDGFCIFTDLHLIQPFTENLSVILDQRLRGFGPEPVFPWRSLPIENHVYAGLRYNGTLGMFQIGANNDYYPKSKPLFIPNTPPGTNVIPKMINGIDASWNLDKDRLNIYAATAYFANSFTFTPDDTLINPNISDDPPFGEALDADLWTDLNIGFSLFSSVLIQGSALLKNDLNSSNSSNLGDYRLGLTGRYNDIRKRFFMDWYLTEHFLGCESVEAGRSSNGFSTELGARVIYKIKPLFLIRGTADIEMAANMLTLHYEAGIRKQWKKGSTLNIFYSGTNGVLFPRQIATIQTKLRLLPHFGVSPDIRIIFGKIGTESKQRYYRSDYALELFFPILKRFEAFGGYLYRHYENHRIFSSYSSISLGLRKW